MPDSSSTGAERNSQAWFTVRTLLGCLLLVLAINEATWRYILPSSRVDLGTRSTTLRFAPVSLGSAPEWMTIAGAWEVSSSDPRFGGLSGIALDGEGLVAVTDFGAVIRFPKPRSGKVAGQISDVMRGPRTTWLKANWDIEAIAADPAGRGWWVAFEHPGEIWLYDRRFGRALERVRAGSFGRSGNTGIEGLAFDRGRLLMFAESGDRVMRIDGRRASVERIEAPLRRISDAASLGPGRVLVIERYVSPLGFRNRLVELVKVPGGYVRGEEVPIPAGPLDNFEGLAIERTSSGTRLWLVTDDNFQKPFRTVLLALDLPRASPSGAR